MANCYLSNKYLWSTYCILAIVLDIKTIAMNKTDKNPAPRKIYSIHEENGLVEYTGYLMVSSIMEKKM